jgi:hypothetical protein
MILGLWYLPKNTCLTEVLAAKANANIALTASPLLKMPKLKPIRNNYLPHSPGTKLLIPWQFAIQALEYVFPSQPHTGV